MGRRPEAGQPMRRRAVVALLLVVLLVGGAALAAFIVWKQRHPGSIRGSASEEFSSTEAPGGTQRSENAVRKVPWPTYGYDDARTRYAAPFKLRPPFRRVWDVQAGSLLEFPPVVAYGRLYVGTNLGRFLALDAKTGKTDWQKSFRRCIAASAVVARRVVYEVLMDPAPCAPHSENAPGYVVAMDAETGEELWRFRSGVVESSPLVVGGTLYFGSWDHKVYALDAKTGDVRWSFTTGDKVKAGPAFAKGLVVIGSYDDKVYALDARRGKLRWSTSGYANFYATPSIAYGRVFIGSPDRRVYAFGLKSGKLLWAHTTGGYVYGAAAVWNKTVFVGSYDHRFYGLDAATGDVRWSFRANGQISGAPTVLDGVVYFATVNRRTYGLDVRTGKKLWTFPDGKYTPVVADEERIYLAGYRKLFGLEPQ